MSPNPEQKQCGEISRSAHFKCAEALHVTPKKKEIRAAFRDPQILDKATNCLRSAGNIMLPSALAHKVGVHRNTAAKLCNYLHEDGKLLRFGRGYEWNPIGFVIPGPMDPI